MPNGKPGDHPFTDIVNHKLDVYSEHADGLIREIAQLADDATRRSFSDRLYKNFNPYFEVDVPALEREAGELRDRLLAEFRDRGLEVPDTD